MAARDACAADVHAATSRMANRAISLDALFRVRGLRLVRRQKWKALAFWHLHDSRGERVFAVLDATFLTAADAEGQGSESGDILNLCGYAEHRDGWSACLRVTALERVLGFREAHPGWTFLADFAPARGNVVVQCPRSHAQRVLEHLVSVACPVACDFRGLSHSPAGRLGTKDRGVVLECPQPAELAAECAQNSLLARVGARVLCVPECALTLDEASAAISRAASRLPARSVRIVAFPRSLADAVAIALEAGGTRVAATGFDAVASIAWSNGLFLWGVLRADEASAIGSPLPTRTLAPTASRAYFKLREALGLHRERPDAQPAHACALAGVHALDLGAAPGGWSSCLGQHGCARVCAVDPAELDPAVSALPCVEHLRMRADEASRVLRSACARPFDLLVCDMNVSPLRAVELIAPLNALVRPGGRLVLTLKRWEKGERAAQLAERTALRALWPAWHSLELVHLCANTPHERTVLAMKRRHALPPALTPWVLNLLSAWAHAGGQAGWRAAAARGLGLAAGTAALAAIATGCAGCAAVRGHSRG